MEMVSAAKMRRAIASVLEIRPYAHSAWSVLVNLARAFDKYQEGLLEVREVKKVLAIAISSNRGLCGSFNSQLFKKIKEELDNPERMIFSRTGSKAKSEMGNKEFEAKAELDFLTIGKKGENFVRKAGKQIVASFNNLTYLPKVEDVRAVSRIVIDDFLAKKYDRVVVFYTDYLSTVSQQTRVRQLLPLSKSDLEKQIAEMDSLAEKNGLKKPLVEYKVEPSPKEVLEHIIPRIIEMQIYHAILESNASKESSRMLAMQNATKEAKEMGNDLTFAYNQIRQMKITQEIAEISAGRAALED